MARLWLRRDAYCSAKQAFREKALSDGRMHSFETGHVVWEMTKFLFFGKI
ncbi:MAG: hypothetical protein IKH04_09295 [Kiritimatiellae bacterium]|nr:hypothetical protein [Kiritimatiellia bacterium]